MNFFLLRYSLISVNLQSIMEHIWEVFFLQILPNISEVIQCFKKEYRSVFLFQFLLKKFEPLPKNSSTLNLYKIILTVLILEDNLLIVLGNKRNQLILSLHFLNLINKA